MKNALSFVFSIIALFWLSFLSSSSYGQTTVCKRIVTGNDDAEQNGNNNAMYLTSSDLELVNDGGRGDQIIGLRFTDIAVPQGATINSASIQFTTDEVSTGACDLTIQGEDIDHSLGFSNSANDISNRSVTTNSVPWSPANWNIVGQAGANQQTPSIVSIIQEIVNRPNYSSGNAITIIITGTGERTAESYNGSAAQAPELCINYTDNNNNPNPSNNICLLISNGDDDVEQNGNNNSIYDNSSDLELVNDGGRGNQIIGLRFSSVTVPAGATITEAYLQFTTDEVSTGACNLLVAAEDIDDSPVFTNTANNVSNRTLTSATANWSPPDWNTVGENGADQKSPDIKSIVQEIVNRPGFSAGNAMSFIISGTGERTAEAYEGSSTNAAQLCISYLSDSLVAFNQIASSNDDVEENGNNGSISTTSSDIELVNDGGRGDQIIGLRFTSINIPMSAEITNAYLQFTVDETNSGAVSLAIVGEDVGNAPAFSTTTNDVSNRTSTTASVNWSPANWNTVGQAGSDQKSPDISNIIQEIVNRGDYTESSAIVLMISGTGERTAESYDGDPQSAARLIVEYKLPTLTWTGANGTNWVNTANWTPNILPSCEYNILIPNVSGASGNAPSISANTDVFSNNLNITAGGSLTINANAVINICGNLTNNGSINNNNSSFNFESTSVAQKIQGSSTTSFYNLTINNSAGVTNIGNTEIINSLTLTSGEFITNNAVTILSSASGTGRINEITGGFITGNITMQRYIDAGATNWRFLTSPVQGSVLEDWDDDFLTSGFAGTDYPDWPTPADPWASLRFYDETVAGGRENGFVVPTSTSDAIGVGRGVWVWSGDTSTGTQPFTIDVTGAPNTGTLSLPVSYTNTGSPTGDGWSMVGNPYPSAIDWDAAGWTKTNVNGAIYIWNPDLQQYASYVSGVGINGGSRYIASSQAFWVVGNASSPVLQITEPCKVNSDQAFLKQKNVPQKILRISIGDSLNKDESILRFGEQAIPDFDADLDAYKLESSNPNVPYIALVNDTSDFSINTISEDVENYTALIRVKTQRPGQYKISLETMNLSLGSCIILEDLENNHKIALSDHVSYSFFLSDTVNSPRFKIHVWNKQPATYQPILCHGDSTSQIIATAVGEGPWVYNWFSSGQLLLEHFSSHKYDTLAQLPSGQYHVQINDRSEMCPTHSDTLFIDEPEAFDISIELEHSSSEEGNGKISLSVGGGVPPYAFNWSNGETAADISMLLPGNYHVLIKDQNGCMYGDTLSITNHFIPSVSNYTFNVFPNPTYGTLTVQLSEELIGGEISLINELGQIALRLSNSSKKVIQFDTQEFPKGIYFLRVVKGNEMKVKKVVVK